MKKVMVLLMMALLLIATLTGCSKGKADPEKAFANSSDAFLKVSEAYIMTNQYSHDIYEAWYLGVNQRKNYEKEYQYFSFKGKMDIESQYIDQAVAKLLGKDAYDYDAKDWEKLPALYNGSYFSAWVSVISEAYVCSGDVDKINTNLIAAKDLMKELGSQYSDYEHYPSLKKYFTNTIAFSDFCQNPEGSFEQVVETFNSYRNNAREYFFDLNYVFSDSIGGINELEEMLFPKDDSLTSDSTTAAG